MKMTDYKILCEQVKSLIQGVPSPPANLANDSDLLWHELPAVHWAGCYLRRGEELVLGPFQGKPACIRIPWGKGVCGTAAKTGLTQRVENVHDFPGHIACDCASNSAIVVPIFQEDRVAAVLDLDSPLFSRFSPGDQQGLEAFVRVLEAEWGNMT